LPFIKVNDHEIFYEIQGEGIPVLLLEGLGYSTWMWKYQLPDFSKHFTSVMPDNRGVGKSEKLTGPYSIEMFAKDSISVMDQLGFDMFYVIGVSMGGFIAQSIAALEPERVKGIVLVSTSCGGKKSIPMSKEVFDQMRLNLNGESSRDRIRRTMSLAFTESFPTSKPDQFNSIIEDRMKSLQPEDQLIYQSLSSINFDSSVSNRNVKVPSLIVAGMEDKVLPWLNSLLIYKSIPTSSLILFKNQNHLLFIEEFVRFNKSVLDFIGAVEGSTYSEFLEEVF
jgi:pimeloyl-ACP methyl ester carboxylesterase